MIAVASGGGSVEVDAVQPEKVTMIADEGRSLVAVDERMVARDAEGIGCGQRREIGLLIGALVLRPRQRRFQQRPGRATPVGAAEQPQLRVVHVEDDLRRSSQSGSLTSRAP